ncbi:MAG: hypothetical protein HRU16_07615, partial [Planctomycetes bacterium]|nr:hypothetical protein [Planctomycetota bacterium]
AIFLQQQATPSLPSPANQAAVGSDTTALEESLSLLRDDVLLLQARLEAIETSSNQQPNPATEILDEAKTDSASSKSVSALLGQDLSSDERLLAAVEAVMDERGVEYTRAALRRSEIEESRDKTTEFVDGSLERVPRIIDQVAREMNLGAARQFQLQDVLLTYSDTAAQLTDELYSDPPPGYDETEQIIAEYWQVFGQLGGQLQEVLNDEELKQFGQIVGVIRQQQAEQQQED